MAQSDSDTTLAPSATCVDCRAEEATVGERCRDCDIDHVINSGSCRECFVFIMREDLAGRPRSKQHRFGCSLKDSPDCYPVGDREIAIVRHARRWAPGKDEP